MYIEHFYRCPKRGTRYGRRQSFEEELILELRDFKEWIEFGYMVMSGQGHFTYIELHV